MSSQTWLETSLRRSSRLGLQVLERAQRRGIDWATASPPPQRTPVDDVQTNHGQTRNKRQPWDAETQEEQERTTLDDAFQTILEFMAQTTHQCKNFYDSVPVQESSLHEAKHVCRHHWQQRPGPPQHNASGKNEQRSSEDFLIEVSPGTYSISARAGESNEQTHMVQVQAGESVNLTFHL